MNILLVEPGYKNKYPPLGLMKIATYHKIKGDNVVFVKGIDYSFNDKKWDRIYITTLFTFHWNICIKTIKYYLKYVNEESNMYVGGILATILEKDLLKEKGLEKVTIIKGLLDESGILGKDKIIVDNLSPDYSIINKLDNKCLNYEYANIDAYYLYATRGCIRHCTFCAVPDLEPVYCNYRDIKEQIEHIKEKYGEKKDLLLMDNNVLASSKFEKIIQDILDSGFSRDAFIIRKNKMGRDVRVKRYVDFNQGIDPRLLTESKMKLLSKLAIKPLRIAFDYATDAFIKLYQDKVYLAAKHNIKYLSNYILYNHKDTPYDLYKRLRVNVDLNQELSELGYDTKIFSFPMRFSPITGKNCRDRKYISPSWTRKQIRGVLCILNATHGIVGPKQKFFDAAFGKDYNEFMKIIHMPEWLILNRCKNENELIVAAWEKLYTSLTDDEKILYYTSVENDDKLIGNLTKNRHVDQLLKKYYLLRNFA